MYPISLTSGWYRRDVCHMIHGSLQGCCNYYSESIANLEERTAYLLAFTKCMEICKTYEYSPKKMLEALDLYKWSLKHEQKPWFFSKERWTIDKLEYKNKAVDQAIELVTSIKSRFLDGNY